MTVEDDKTLPSRPSVSSPDPDVESVDLGNKFQVLGSLGKGGMGSVLKVRHLPMGRLRAVKILHLESASRDPSILERFRREATVASDLQHPNIVRIFDFDFTPAGLPYIAMEYLEGRDLQNLVARDGPCTPATTVGLLAGVANALDKVHSMGIVHRDLKPANLFRTNDGIVKILDFGISHVEWDGAAITETGDILGTPVFMAPEQLRGEGVDHRADIYALAAVAHELLTGHHAIEATNPAMLVAGILEGNRVPVTDRVDGIPSEVEAAVARGMSLRPEDRFDSASELVGAIAAGAGLDAAAIETVDLATGPTVLRTGNTLRGNRSSAQGEPGKHRALRIAASIALLLVACGSIVWYLKGDGGVETSPETPAATKMEWPLLILPADVVVPEVDAGWASMACSDLFSLFVSLHPGSKFISDEEAREKLGEAWRHPGKDVEAQTIKELVNRSGAKSVATLDLDGALGKLRLRTRLYDGSGKMILEHLSEGPSLDAVIDDATWAMREISGETSPLGDEDRSRCGADDDDLCSMALMAERALMDHGLLTRVERLAKELGEHPQTRIWRSISRTFSCLESPDLKKCLEARDIGEPPSDSRLSQSRKELWSSIGVFSEEDPQREKRFCELVDDDDPLVSGLAATWSLDNECPGKNRVICNKTDNFLLRYECMVKTTMYDDPDTAWRYYQEFSELDLAHPMVTATFSMHPMRRDIETAHMWLQRVRLRTTEYDPLVANSLVRIELARRNPHEAMVWARRSVNPRWREGQAHLLGGKLRQGQEGLAEGAREMLLSDETPAPYMFHVILRPALQPMLTAGVPELAEEWFDADGTPQGGLPPDATEAIEIAKAVRDGLSADGCSHIDEGSMLALEWLYICRDWKNLIKLSANRMEQSYAARASAFLVADANLELGNLAEAKKIFTIVESDAVSRSIFPASSVIALERLGTIALKEGDEETAELLFSQMADLWKDADSDIPALTRARENLARLSGTPAD